MIFSQARNIALSRPLILLDSPNERKSEARFLE